MAKSVVLFVDACSLDIPGVFNLQAVGQRTGHGKQGRRSRYERFAA